MRECSTKAAATEEEKSIRTVGRSHGRISFRDTQTQVDIARMYYPQMDFNNFPAFTGTDKQLEELLSSQQDLNAFYQQQQYQSSTASTPVMSNATLSADVLLQDLLFDDTPSSSNTHTRRSSFSSTDSIMDSLHNMSFASPAKNTLDAFMPSNSPLSELDLFALFSSPVPQALALPKPQSFQQPNLTLDMTLLASQQQPDFDSYFFTGPEAISTTDFKIETMDSEESTPTAGAADLIAPLMRKPSTKSVKKKTVTKRRSSSSTPSSSPDTRDRNHECETCHARFLRYQDLHRHKAVHATTRDFKCPYNCGSTFARADAVTRHLRKKSCRLAPVDSE
ncbi:hypothetical protein BCR33DRAFT_788901 [Rhizoclosmatium globosum]|uniref:C2H2-type domain-containing protein n=1 Tax=Rhizoclosmatium globosum TaxID=329046 RepID=A0A1Y2BVJ5_9FUNG|nr:hypothetical protein BCR33DRAFT_788901 [Rhizoclosmatium globosum]|eukprot:ORY38694.1 hypothetical protein BCR33DRAFT_788901 [Rhizoclosmatium globosum]